MKKIKSPFPRKYRIGKRVTVKINDFQNKTINPFCLVDKQSVKN